MDFNDLTEEKISSEDIFKGKILYIKKDKVKLPNGKTADRELVRHIGAVCVIPVTDDGKVILVRQFRYPIGETVLEVPAGKLDSPDEDRLEAAKRELREETGFTADEWTDLGIYYPSPAYCDEKLTVYLARGLHKGEQSLDEDEFLNVRIRDLSALVTDVMSGEITDGKTQVAVLKAAMLLL